LPCQPEPSLSEAFLRPQRLALTAKTASGLRPDKPSSGLRPEGSGPASGSGSASASGSGLRNRLAPPAGSQRLRLNENGDPNPQTCEAQGLRIGSHTGRDSSTSSSKGLSLREVNSRSGIGLPWLKAECQGLRAGRKVEGKWRIGEEEVDRLRLRWERARRRQVNESGRGFRRGGEKYRHDGG